MVTQGEPRKPAGYEPPALTVLGKANTLTQGPSSGPNIDGIMPLHTSP